MKKTNAFRDVELSKFLSFVLRHKPEAIGLRLDGEGWVDIQTLLSLAAEHGNIISPEQLEKVVAESDKKRFTISEDGLKIRAAQGHSTKQVDIGFSPKTPPDTLFHGTADRFMNSIRNKGLVPGERQYVHLSSDHETAISVGTRHGNPVVLSINTLQMVKDGFLFYLSDNNVWLTKHVPPEYLDR